MRLPERLFVCYFAYVAVASEFFRSRPNLHQQPVFYLLGAAAVFGSLSWLERDTLKVPIRILRDWLPIVFTFIAFREMELFVPASYDLRFEASWIGLDLLVLNHWGLRSSIESLGKIVPLYLELCYLLVYGLAAYALGWISSFTSRRTIDYFWTVYLTGTLTAYALFPYFPSLPPRYAFPLVQAPTIITWVRSVNLWLLNGATIHAGVFPSAHVSSAFSSTWAFYLIFPKERWLGHVALLYAVSVSIATVYGRYHYVADVLAGFAVSLIALGVGFRMKNYVPKHQSPETPRAAGDS